MQRVACMDADIKRVKLLTSAHTAQWESGTAEADFGLLWVTVLFQSLSDLLCSSGMDTCHAFLEATKLLRFRLGQAGCSCYYGRPSNYLPFYFTIYPVLISRCQCFAKHVTYVFSLFSL